MEQTHQRRCKCGRVGAHFGPGDGVSTRGIPGCPLTGLGDTDTPRRRCERKEGNEGGSVHDGLGGLEFCFSFYTKIRVR